MWSMETKLHQNNDLELGVCRATSDKYPPYMLCHPALMDLRYVLLQGQMLKEEIKNLKML